ncbi:Gfo/Idh/MocA family oxidoreductase [Tibeticola sp.]|uniref:Gfo/Idh/MocA family protein n=1 Tax=Tibeticola sp. TaxID=2005368 RepID=UPI0025D2188A|nr:Gfo/Idh/MocA family oxidoreductase [Tibeticola sp.]
MSEALSVLIVGCGNVAGGYDSGPDDSQAPLTHAGAYHRHPGFRLAACIEPDDARRRAFQARWGVPSGWSCIAQLPAGSRFDVISICSPTPMHLHDVRASLALSPRLIFCEKPIAPSSREAAEVVSLCDQAGVPLAVNHTRRWAPDVVNLAKRLTTGEWGPLRSISGLYNKGVLNNGSHLIDLLHALVGPVEPVAALAPVADGMPGDPTVPALLKAVDTGLPIHLRTAHAADYAVFELELVMAGGVLCMEDGGFRWRERRAQESPDFPGYRSLGSGSASAGEYRQAMTHAVDNLHSAVVRNEPLRSTGATALKAQLVCERIHELSTMGAHHA